MIFIGGVAYFGIEKFSTATRPAGFETGGAERKKIHVQLNGILQFIRVMPVAVFLTSHSAAPLLSLSDTVSVSLLHESLSLRLQSVTSLTVSAASTWVSVSQTTGCQTKRDLKEKI